MIGLILTGLLKANLAASAAMLAAAPLRGLVRPRFGAQASYLMWLAPLAAGLATLAPHPAARGALALAPAVASATAAVGEFVAQAPAAVTRAGPDLASVAFGLWLVGLAATAALLLRRQAAFLSAMGRLERRAGGVFRAERDGVGPAVVGVFRPRIVTPCDFETRFGAQERALILAHEGVHLRRGDAAVNALVCAVQCLCWFNPLAHLAARLLRIDQELACDAAVIDRFPDARRTYAELLLKTQLGVQPLPLGCHWPASAQHPLRARIAMLTSPLPPAARRGLGLAVAAALTLGAGSLAWSAQPGEAAGPGPAQRAEALRQLALHPSYTCDPELEAKGVGCKIIAQSTWLAVATPQDIARAYPKGAREAGQTARVRVRCTVAVTGLMKACSVVDVSLQVPPGEGATQAAQDAFGQAALRLTRYYQFRPPSPLSAPAREGHGTFGIEFGAFRADPNDPAAPPWAKKAGYTPPPGYAEPRGAPAFRSIWLKKPSGDDLMKVYPAEAVAKGLTGEVVMACKVAADGRLTGCDVRRVDVGGAQAPDPGFGAATLELAKLFQMEPVNAAGRPTAGTEIRIPVRFALPQTAAPR